VLVEGGIARLPWVVAGAPTSGRAAACADEPQQRAADLLGVSPRDRVRPSADGNELDITDIGRHALAGLLNGTAWSASPCTTSTGTSILCRPVRKSVFHVAMRATAAADDAAISTADGPEPWSS
jgi:hypothetical protein